MTSKQYLSNLNLIYFAQGGMMLLFTGVLFGLVYSGNIITDPNGELTKMLTYVLAIVLVSGFSGAHFLYQFLLSRINKGLEFKAKMPKYVGAMLVRSACLELPGLFAAIVFFLSGNFYLLLIPVFIAVVFFLLRPTPATIAEDLNLTPSERALLDNPDAVITEG